MRPSAAHTSASRCSVALATPGNTMPTCITVARCRYGHCSARRVSGRSGRRPWPWTNFLRIHIKTEVPRRLYWAYSAGVLIMEDMPSTRTFTERGQKAWEAVMRGAIPRDRNHPSILAWCLFNETWGLGSLQSRTDIQNWVLAMWNAAKELDPTRLVEDNSPNKLDHVKTDLNSFHFYIDDRSEEHTSE